MLAVAALILLWSASPPPAARRLIPLGWALAAAGTLTALAVFLVRVTLGDPPQRPPSSWPPTAARLTEDIQATAVDRLLTTASVVALILLAAGALLVGLGWAWQTRPTVRIPIEPRHALALTAVVRASALIGTILAPVAMTGPAPRVCQGSSRLCDVRYDELAQLAAHNAMATTADRFIGPLQAPDIVGQLNVGVRSLLIDTRALARVNPYRPVLWLCHSVCCAGALELAPTAADRRLAAHPPHEGRR